jgi:hypothetical protein
MYVYIYIYIRLVLHGGKGGEGKFYIIDVIFFDIIVMSVGIDMY